MCLRKAHLDAKTHKEMLCVVKGSSKQSDKAMPFELKETGKKS